MGSDSFPSSYLPVALRRIIDSGTKETTNIKAIKLSLPPPPIPPLPGKYLAEFRSALDLIHSTSELSASLSCFLELIAEHQELFLSTSVFDITYYIICYLCYLMYCYYYCYYYFCCCYCICCCCCWYYYYHIIIGLYLNMKF